MDAYAVISRRRGKRVLERVEDLEQIIQRLVEFDKKGRALVQEAQQQRRDVLSHMSDYKQDMATHYRERSEISVETFRTQATADRDEQLLAARRRFDEQSARLRANYQKNCDRWVQQLVDRCVGR